MQWRVYQNPTISAVRLPVIVAAAAAAAAQQQHPAPRNFDRVPLQFVKWVFCIIFNKEGQTEDAREAQYSFFLFKMNWTGYNLLQDALHKAMYPIGYLQ